MDESLIVFLSRIPDPRADRGRRHLFTDILVIAVLSVLCGGETWTDMEDFGRARERWLRQFLRLPHGIPSAETFASVFAAMDRERFEACFRAWTAHVASAMTGVISLDGKTLRGSGTADRKPIHMVSAWASDNGVVFGQVACEEKSNEITAIPELLRYLRIKGLIVTIDAMGCQRGIARQIVEQGGDYVLQIKANQPTLQRDVMGLFDWAEGRGFDGMRHSSSESTDKEHGRLETRRVDMLWDLRQIGDIQAWSKAACVVRVRCERTTGGTTSRDAHYYLSSVSHKRSQEMGRICRAHWGVENQLHWCLDVAFREDQSRTHQKNAAENLSRLRRLVLNVLRLDITKKIGLRRKRFWASQNEEYLRHLFSLLGCLPETA